MKDKKVLIFDVGNVLFSYRWHEMLLEYGLSEEEACVADEKVFDGAIWREMDLGIKSSKDIMDYFSRKHPEYHDLIRWFFSHPEKMPIPHTEIWKRIHLLKEKGYKIYLLSNYPKELFAFHTKDADFMKDIDGKVVSYEIHVTKPNLDIYKHLLEKYSLNPKECAFFDDREENTKAAEALGILSYTVTSEEYLRGVLDVLCRC